MLAHVSGLVVSVRPRSARRKPSVATLRLCAHWKTATYRPRNHLLTPRNGRRKVRTPAHSPSQVLLCPSRTPSPSSSRAHSPRPRAWRTAACRRPVPATPPYPTHSSVFRATPGRVAARTNASSGPAADDRATRNRTRPVSRPATPRTGGRSPAQVPWPRFLLARRRGGSGGSRCRTPFFPRVLVQLVGLGHPVGQRRGVLGPAGPARPAVPPRQQAGPGQAGV